jgi:hypothetical protein
VGSLTDEVHGARTQPPQRFKGVRAKSMSRALMVCIVGPVVVGVPARSSVSGGAEILMEVCCGQEMDK